MSPSTGVKLFYNKKVRVVRRAQKKASGISSPASPRQCHLVGEDAPGLTRLSRCCWQGTATKTEASLGRWFGVAALCGAAALAAGSLNADKKAQQARY